MERIVSGLTYVLTMRSLVGSVGSPKIELPSCKCLAHMQRRFFSSRCRDDPRSLRLWLYGRAESQNDDRMLPVLRGAVNEIIEDYLHHGSQERRCVDRYTSSTKSELKVPAGL
jgi:hypothetical protein